MEDLIVEEIRNTRRQIEAECDGDFKKLFQKIIESQKNILIKLFLESLEFSHEKRLLRSFVPSSIPDVITSGIPSMIFSNPISLDIM
jgi:hypothetical protein